MAQSAEGMAVLGMVAVSEVAEWHRSAEGVCAGDGSSI